MRSRGKPEFSWDLGSSRKGMELAINTLVVMILGMLIVGGGIIMLARLSTSGEETVTSLTRAQREALQGLLTEGQLVAVAPQHQKIVPGKSAIIGLGVVNKRSTATHFSVHVRGMDSNRQQLSDWKYTWEPAFTLNVHEQQRKVIAITAPRTAPEGVYTFFVNITYEEQGQQKTYDSTRMFTLRVE